MRPRISTPLTYTITSKIREIYPKFMPAGRDCHRGFRGRGKVLRCVWATAWYVAICLLPARRRSLAAVRHLLCVSTTLWYVTICLLPMRKRSLAAVRQALTCRFELLILYV